MRKPYFIFVLFSLALLYGLTGYAQSPNKAILKTLSADGRTTVVKEIALPAQPAQAQSLLAPAFSALSTAAVSTSCPANITRDNEAGQCGAEVNYTPPACETLTQTEESNNFSGGVFYGGCAAHYLRAYDLPADGYTNGFTVTSVSFGVGQAYDPSGRTPLTVNVYQWNPATALTYANFTLVGSEDFTVPNQFTQLVTQPVSAVISAGYGMIVEIVTEKNNNFFMGHTSSSQTAPSYYYIACRENPGIKPDFFGEHYVLNANGCAGEESITQTAGLPSGSLFPVGTTTNTFQVAGTTVCSFTVTVVSDFTATIPDVKALSKGVENNTVYKGYAPASCLTLTAQASGGSGSYEYQWQKNGNDISGATSATLQVCPSATATYTVIITDADGQGCSTTASKQVKVVDVRCGSKNDKVEICHKPTRKTLCISKGDVASHLAHGDYLGTCGRTSEAYEIVNKEIGVEAGILNPLTLSVRGNPAPDFFTLLPSSSSTHPLSLRVMDASGRIVESRGNVPSQSSIEFGHGYRSGIYWVEVVQGQQRVTLKLMKTP